MKKYSNLSGKRNTKIYDSSGNLITSNYTLKNNDYVYMKTDKGETNQFNLTCTSIRFQNDNGVYDFFYCPKSD